MFLEIPATMFSYVMNTVFWWISFGGRIPWKVTVSWKISTCSDDGSRQTSGGSSKPQCNEKPVEAEAIFFSSLGRESPRNLIWKVVLRKCLWLVHSTNWEAETVHELLGSVQLCDSLAHSCKGSEKSAGNPEHHPAVAHPFGEVKDCRSIKEEDECTKSGFSKQG